MKVRKDGTYLMNLRKDSTSLMKISKDSPPPPPKEKNSLYLAEWLERVSVLPGRGQEGRSLSNVLRFTQVAQ